MNAVEVAEWMEPLLRMFIIFTTNSDGTDVAYGKIFIPYQLHYLSEKKQSVNVLEIISVFF